MNDAEEMEKRVALSYDEIRLEINERFPQTRRNEEHDCQGWLYDAIQKELSTFIKEGGELKVEFDGVQFDIPRTIVIDHLCVAVYLAAMDGDHDALLNAAASLGLFVFRG
jgi:hypothetical protein